MATQLQGPPSDPCVLYKHFWQELQQPMHKDDLILQACHYQPSDTPLGPSFSPCDYFPSPWKKRASQSGSLALLFPIGPTNGRESEPLPACQSPAPFRRPPVTTPPHFHRTSAGPWQASSSRLAACGPEASRWGGGAGAGLKHPGLGGLASHTGAEKDKQRLPPSQTPPSAKESHPQGHVLFH